jgi:hypothetical protein
MTPTPPPHAQYPPGGKKGGWILPTVIIGTVVLALCCVSGIVIVALSGDNGTDAAAGADPTSTPGDQPVATLAAEPEPAPEPDGFGPGTWEVGTEIPAGTYVTIVPDGGIFDSCYWARLSGFSGSFDDIITNENLNAGARGRLEIASSDAGVEFLGRLPLGRGVRRPAGRGRRRGRRRRLGGGRRDRSRHLHD